MTTLHQAPNAFRATHLEGVDKELQYMNTNLEEIQKSLEMYLENKRRQFPRFYFISNDDLLEILGQSKNPPGVMPHMKKLFDNIKTLTLVKTTGNGPMAATEMRSNEDEVVPFDGQVTSSPGSVDAHCSSCAVLGHSRWASGEMVTWRGEQNERSRETQGARLPTRSSELRNETREMAEISSRSSVYHSQSNPMDGRSTEISAWQCSQTEIRSKKTTPRTEKLHRPDQEEPNETRTYQAGLLGHDWDSCARCDQWFDQKPNQNGIVLRMATTVEILLPKGRDHHRTSHRTILVRMWIPRQFRSTGYHTVDRSVRMSWLNEQKSSLHCLCRCYMTLTIALSLCRGGSPKGPAGKRKCLSRSNRCDARPV